MANVHTLQPRASSTAIAEGLRKGRMARELFSLLASLHTVSIMWVVVDRARTSARLGEEVLRSC